MSLQTFNPLENQRAEVFNPHRELAVVLTTRHPDMAMQPFHWHYIKIKPGKHRVIPHLAYTALFEDGSVIPENFLTVNFGKAIGQGIESPDQCRVEQPRKDER